MNVSRLKPMLAIHSAFCMAVFTFGVLSIFMRTVPVYFNFGQTNDFFPLFPILGLVSIVLSMFLFRRQISGLPETASFDEKITRYQTAFLIRCAFLEAAALMNIVAFLKDPNVIFIATALLAFLILLLTRPGKHRIVNELKIEYPDTEKL